jgi:menaquinone-specific isochorismate synthase
MPVIPHQLSHYPDHKDLYQFFLRCKQSISSRDEKIIASVSLLVPKIDLLAVLETVVETDQRYFYFENRDRDESVLAFDTAVQFIGNGIARFADAKALIQTTLAQTHQIGASEDAPFSGVHFFCSFSFFDEITESAVFPAATVFLPRWQVARSTQGSTIVANVVINQTFNPEIAVHEVWQTLQKIQSVKYQAIPLALETPKAFFKQQSVSQPERFKKTVTSTLALIQAKRFHKIVLADALDIISPIALNIITSLHNLRSHYPNCYIFSVNNGNGTTFIGASPEKLVSIDQNRLMTDALAGSVARGKTRAEDARFAQALLNSAKDKHEHQVVIDSISQHLRNLGLTPQLAPARLLQLPNIQHLLTPIRASVPSSVHLLDAVAELHPTPAVAGEPRQLACEQIQELEPFERSLYAAPIGWVDHAGNGEFAVGIRSALIHGNRARLFAGAGIVAGSNPDKEFAEVQLKLQALLNALA